MLIDIHAHYPMHVHGGSHAGVPLGRWLRERAEGEVIELASKVANYEGPGDTPSVSMDLIRKGPIGAVLSVLYCPFDEIEPGILIGEGPGGRAPRHLLDQLELVEDDLDHRGDAALVVRSRGDLDRALAGGLTAMVHCVEGGFALGDDADQVDATVATLADRGVAYVTLAHLFWRRVATNAPALPFLTDGEYHKVFGQPAGVGLAPLGEAAVDALGRHGVVIDVSHMSELALTQTLDRVEAATAGREPDDVPVIASHAACRFVGGLEYNLSDDSINRIADLGGLVGLICCTHYIAFGQPQPDDFDGSLEALCRHIDRIVALRDGSFDNIAIGSDLDGFIKPALPGLKTIDQLAQLETALIARYGPVNGELICSANALRMLRYRFPGA